ncbi:hypothetical protein [Cellvibrio sp. QJXJ]|uniref:hypothetical protein n=1 Tax=Cellvibrio sp. QJXJ TaxID=2964606 RepID=UPI0021C331F9|nr:hypothetical protein [Cellvibrio sp. QJXJ]UUA75148.1 hypothetical protein NNX04_22080 [Cellvibrio sp. QJXJ]
MSAVKKVAVACCDANGSSTIVTVTLDVSAEQVANGEHIELAIESVEGQGYEAPFLVFEGNEIKNIAKVVQELDCPIPFTLKDADTLTGSPQQGNILFAEDNVCVQLLGFSDAVSEDDVGIVAHFDYNDGNLLLRAFADINEEDPTTTIDFSGARNEMRLERV